MKQRNLLSREDQLKRSYYEILRDDLDKFAIHFSLVESYEKFLQFRVPYPFVELKELKPRARVPSVEYKNHNPFLIIFCENHINSKHKKYIRYFNDNKTTKENLLKHKYFPDAKNFKRDIKFLETQDFFSFLKSLLHIDCALLIQRNKQTRVRYGLTHFHVKIDWPIVEASEDLAKYLRYVSKDIYEKGDKYAEDLQKKFFEYYGVPPMSGGRRTAAIVAAQYFRKIKGITTVYISSSEARCLFKIDEGGLSKFILAQISEEKTKRLFDIIGITRNSFTKNYVIAKNRRSSVCIFSVKYEHTSHALPPVDSRLREVNSDINWLTISQETIIPKYSAFRYPPIPFKMVYS